LNRKKRRFYFSELYDIRRAVSLRQQISFSFTFARVLSILEIVGYSVYFCAFSLRLFVSSSAIDSAMTCYM